MTNRRANVWTGPLVFAAFALGMPHARLTAAQSAGTTGGATAQRAARAAGPATFDGGRAYEHVRQIVTFGPRPAGSPALDRTRRYITDQLTALGITTVEQAFEAQTPVGTIRMVNLIATIPGARKERLVIAGHYDTKLFREFRFVGANDAGSSTAFLLEIARVLKSRRNPLTIELLFLDGEEAMVEWTATDHTYGSRHYVDTARKSGTLATLKALILVDMIGDRNLRIRREQASTLWLTDLIWASARRLKLDSTFVAESMPIEDDHVPFLQAGVPAVDIIDLDYPPWHTAGDTLDQVSARSLQMVGDVVLDALPQIEARLSGTAARTGRGN
jgi:glutaminyl-peptide cyclotransferase